MQLTVSYSSVKTLLPVKVALTFLWLFPSYKLHFYCVIIIWPTLKILPASLNSVLIHMESLEPWRYFKCCREQGQESFPCQIHYPARMVCTNHAEPPKISGRTVVIGAYNAKSTTLSDAELLYHISFTGQGNMMSPKISWLSKHSARE